MCHFHAMKRATGSTHLVQSVDLYGEAVDPWHGRHGLELWQV